MASTRAQAAEPRWLTEKEQDAWRAYIMGTTLLLDRLDRELRQRHDVSLNEYEVLVRLSEQPAWSMRMAVLAEAMGHSRSRTTHTVQRMEKAGLVRRRAASGDGRGVVAVLTDKGAKLLVSVAPVHVEGVREHLLDLADPDDLHRVGRVFDAVCDHLLADVDEAADIRAQHPRD